MYVCLKKYHSCVKTAKNTSTKQNIKITKVNKTKKKETHKKAILKWKEQNKNEQNKSNWSQRYNRTTSFEKKKKKTWNRTNQTFCFVRYPSTFFNCFFSFVTYIFYILLLISNTSLKRLELIFVRLNTEWNLKNI